MAKKHHIDQDEIRRIRVLALVDTGSKYMCINENIQEYLQLASTGRTEAMLANGVRQKFKVVGPLTVEYEHYHASCDAIVLPEGCEPLLGAIPMQSMNIVISPQEARIIEGPPLRF